jgi:hypothetical protein
MNTACLHLHKQVELEVRGHDGRARAVVLTRAASEAAPPAGLLPEGSREVPSPPPPSPLVLSGHAASVTPY